MAPCYEYGTDLTYTVSNCDNTTAGGTYDGIYPYTNRMDTGGTSHTVTWTSNIDSGRMIYNDPIIWRPGTYQWDAQLGNAIYDTPPVRVPYVAPIFTPEQAETFRLASLEMLEEQRIWKEQEAVRRAAQVTREQKAEGLIKEILGEIQYTALKKRGYIDIPSGFDPTKRYRIRPHRMIGIVKQVNGEWQEVPQALCIHPTHGYVEGDVVATKIALCKFDERELLKTANVHERLAA